MLIHAVAVDPLVEFSEDVRAGLGRDGQKELLSKYLYDEIGSALFEVITVLPEYGLSRAEERILRQHADSIAGRIEPPVIVVELGSGTGKKTRWILEAVARRHLTTYHPIEISLAALTRCEHELDHLHRVNILGFETEYLDGLRRAAARREPGQHLLVLFLGSSIGNFDREPGEEFLGKVREALEPGDALLLGTDLEKPVDRLLRAYDDSLDVTAAFDLNVLARINRELDGDFELSQFQHLALYNRKERRIEIITVRKAECAVILRRGETIWTESSHKYQPEEVIEMAARAGFGCEAQWIDREWPFAQSLLVPR